MFKIEKKFIKYIQDYHLVLGFAGVTMLALTMRLLMLDFESKDYLLYLSPWFDYLKENGGIRALATYIGNYNAPYMTILALLTYIPIKKIYLIKAISIIFDFALALSAGFLVKYIVPKNKNLYFLIVYGVILFYPEVVINSAIWGQCDSGYATFVILALLALLKEKYLRSFIFLGLAFSLKLQFIFILPVFVIVYFVKKRFTILYFLIIPAVNFILCLPAIIVGRPISKILTVYLYQIDEYKISSTLNFLNVYGLVSHNVNELQVYGIYITMVVLLMMLIYVIAKNIKLDNQKILNLSLWFLVVTTFLLPRMHDRYLYVGAILAIIYFVLYRKNLLLLVSITICSISTYFSYLFETEITNKKLLIIMYAVVIVFYTKDLFKMLGESTK